MSRIIAGSRPGSLVAGAWVAMMSLGEEGFHNVNLYLCQAARPTLLELLTG